MAAVVLNFMCVLAWALGWPDIWADIILGVSVRVFWVRLTFKLEGSRLPSPRWVGHTQSVHWNKRLNLPWGRENSSCLTGVELGCHLFPASGEPQLTSYHCPSGGPLLTLTVRTSFCRFSCLTSPPLHHFGQLKLNSQLTLATFTING